MVFDKTILVTNGMGVELDPSCRTIKAKNPRRFLVNDNQRSIRPGNIQTSPTPQLYLFTGSGNMPGNPITELQFEEERILGEQTRRRSTMFFDPPISNCTYRNRHRYSCPEIGETTQKAQSPGAHEKCNQLCQDPPW